MLIDFHTHLHDKQFDLDRDIVLQNLKDNDIQAVTIGTDLEESRKAMNLANANSHIYYTIGLHPEDNREEIFDKNKYIKLAMLNGDLNPKLKAIGECGLDYFYLKDLSIEEIVFEKKRQEKYFREQIELAIELNLPLMLHIRDEVESLQAYKDVLNILQDYRKFNIKGNVHFFAGNVEIAKEFIDIGFTFSFGGVLTLSHDYDEVLKSIPLELIFAETDSPYVVPKNSEGKRVSKRNSSEYIDIIYSKIAEIKELDLEKVKSQLEINFANF